ncbi:hypothetical protein A1O1_00818 [Capronia coronata CBS 617.96]|uniref:NAD(P)-binding domain-containing protein n=1 Tax=Capronia coronata CBS 617.96 TaxID=1182541 RepID=W9Z156_9EURO|nr:uncharacterized protein A1O1_00818 [Capronia coronata CBS 617.96]EXJ95695.1 hypothetical protein A1O1_00818 [Capronia coronata CBS 617.96]
MTTTIGIAGISGKFARLLANALLTYPEARIRGLCRSPSKVPASVSSSPQVQVVQGDAFDADALHAFVKGCDVVVCCYLGDDRVMIDGQELLINVCEEEGVPRYVASDWALDYTKLQLGELFPKDPMIHVKAHLDAKKNIKGVHILTGGFLEVLFSPVFGVWDPQNTTFRYWGTGNEVWEGTTYKNSAEYTAAVCLDSAAVGVLRFLGACSTTHEIAATYEKVYGIKPKTECLGSLEELYEQMHRLRKNEPENVYSYMFKFYTYYLLSGRVSVGPNLDNDKYPQVKVVTFEDLFKSVPREELSQLFVKAGQ